MVSFKKEKKNIIDYIFCKKKIRESFYLHCYNEYS